MACEMKRQPSGARKRNKETEPGGGEGDHEIKKYALVL